MQRQIANPTIQGILAIANWLLVVVFVASYAMQLGGTVQA
jgi:hypothetical protein